MTQAAPLRIIILALALLAPPFAIRFAHAEEADAPPENDYALSLIVMDPLAAPLSCPCVEGYAQRKYEALAEYLTETTGRKVRLTFAEALGKALKGKAKGRADLIIGKDSVVRADAKKQNLQLTSVARLTDKQGKTTQTGLIVVPKDDPAKTTKDLREYRIIFGPAEAEEKHQAAFALLRSAGIPIPEKLEIDEACSEGACKILEFKSKVRGAAVISSYAQPLLTGCGVVKKGDLRVVGQTKPVPFVTAFTTSSVSETERQAIQQSLLNVLEKPELCLALESLLGFVAVDEARAEAAPAKQPASAAKKNSP